MTGLLYKSFYLNRFVLLFNAALQLGVLVAVIAIDVNMWDGSVQPSAESASFVTFLFTFFYYLQFYFASMMFSEVFRPDESRVCSAFAMSTPLGAKGYIKSKYFYIIIVLLLNVVSGLITDGISAILTNGEASAWRSIILLFFFRVFMAALEMPFIVRFGADKGSNIQFSALSGFLMLIMVYILFGDISFLLGDDPIAEFFELISEQNLRLYAIIFVIVSVIAYFVSYLISVKVYRKGTESYDM